MPRWLIWPLFVVFAPFGLIISVDYMASYFYLVCIKSLKFSVSLGDLFGDRSQEPINYNGVIWHLPQFSGIVSVVFVHLVVWFAIILYLSNVMSTPTYKGIRWNYIFDKMFYKKPQVID